MKRNILILILIIILVVIGFNGFNTYIDSKELKKKEEVYEKYIDSVSKEDSGLRTIIDDLKDSLRVSDDNVNSLQKDLENSRMSAREANKKYSDLKKLKPKTQGDSLEVATSMVDALVEENTAQDNTIRKLDSIVSIQGSQIKDLKEIATTHELMIDNKDKIIVAQKELIERLKKENKKLKREKVFNTIKNIAIGVAVGIALSAI